MPWDPNFRKPDVKGIVAKTERSTSWSRRPRNAADLRGRHHLPNDNKVREHHGSKSVSAVHIREAGDNANPGTTRGEFSWTRKEADARPSMVRSPRDATTFTR